MFRVRATNQSSRILISCLCDFYLGLTLHSVSAAYWSLLRRFLRFAAFAHYAPCKFTMKKPTDKFLSPKYCKFVLKYILIAVFNSFFDKSYTFFTGIKRQFPRHFPLKTAQKRILIAVRIFSQREEKTFSPRWEKIIIAMRKYKALLLLSKKGGFGYIIRLIQIYRDITPQLRVNGCFWVRYICGKLRFFAYQLRLQKSIRAL